MQGYENGGLRLTNVDYFIEALKAGWIRRIFDEQNKGLWREYYLEKLNVFCLECNLNVNDCNQIVKGNSFLHDVLAAWCKINFSEIMHALASEVIWNKR